MARNDNLHAAKVNKNDEFYTKLEDIEIEVEHYRKHFIGKTVLCNCDDPTWSNFWKYFHTHFRELQLRELISTHYNKNGEASYAMFYKGGNDADLSVCVKQPLTGNGDFTSQECLNILDAADIVCTNPPFSLFSLFVSTLIEHKKDFLIIGNKNTVGDKVMFPLFKDNKVWFGYSSPSEFYTPDGEITKKVQGLCRWFTNLDIDKRHEKLLDTLTHSYIEEPDLYPRYDNYNVINVGYVGSDRKRQRQTNKVSFIPNDYYGVMGVPVTFIDRYNPEEFEIIGRSGDIEWAENECEFFCLPPEEKRKEYKAANKTWRAQNAYVLVDGNAETMYSRLFIRRKKNARVHNFGDKEI